MLTLMNNKYVICTYASVMIEEVGHISCWLGGYFGDEYIFGVWIMIQTINPHLTFGLQTLLTIGSFPGL